MTCIVAVAKNGVVHMGGDTGGVDTDSGLLFTYKDPKVFIRKGYLIGYAGSYSFGKMLQHTLDLPDIPHGVNSPESVEKFVNGVVMPSLRKQAKALDLSNDESDFDCLFGIKGHIFEVFNDWFALEPTNSFASVGSGSHIAFGSLYTTETWKDPVQRINVALRAAAEYSTSVSGPFTILSK